MIGRTLMLSACVAVLLVGTAGAQAAGASIVKKVIRPDENGENLLNNDAWGTWGKGFTRDGAEFVCDNGSDATVQRGASQTVRLDQKAPDPIVATAMSRCDSVSGAADSNYSVYLDLVYIDGSHLWGQSAPFDVGTHDWQKRQVVVFPEKPVRQVSMHLLMRSHSGRAWFRDPVLRDAAHSGRRSSIRRCGGDDASRTS